MRHEKIVINVPGQLGPAAILETYLLDNQMPSDRKRPAVIICPGGGYGRLSKREAEPVALKVLAMGCHAMVLYYSVSPNRFPVSLLQLAKAVSIVREHDAEWRVDAGQIFVMGFSAGGHLACSLGVFWNSGFIYETLQLKPEMIKPAGMILCYPVITMDQTCAHQGSMANLVGEGAGEELRNQVSLEKWVSKETPRTFLWHTDTDQSVPVQHSYLLAKALKKYDVSLEFHVFKSGGHGLALASAETAGEDAEMLVPGCQIWIQLLENWIKA